MRRLNLGGVKTWEGASYKVSGALLIIITTICGLHMALPLIVLTVKIWKKLTPSPHTRVALYSLLRMSADNV